MIMEADRLLVKAIRNFAGLYNDAFPSEPKSYPPALLIPVTNSFTVGTIFSGIF